MTGPQTYPQERDLVTEACRVLVARGLVDGLLGHVSLRIDDDLLLVRCRGPQERGLADTTPRDVRLVTLDGEEGAPGELADGYAPPNELPLHTEVLRTRPDAQAVVHAHPESVVAFDLAGQRIRPIVGSLDIPGARLAAAGVPVYPRAVLVRDRVVAAEMVDALGERSVVILRGHGLTSVGATVQEAVLQAVSVDRIARIGSQVLAAGGTLTDLPEDDLAALPDLGGTLNLAAAWRHEIARAERRLGP